MKKTLLLAAIGLFLGSALTPASAFADDKPKKEKKKKSKKNKEPEFVIEKAELKDGGDSLAYIFGVWQTNGLKDYMAGQLGVDTAYIQDFSRGIIDRVSIDPADQKMKAYLAGQQIANQIEQMANQISKDYYSAQPDKKISPKIIANAIVLSLMGKGEMSVDSAQAVFQKTMEKRQEENKETLYGENRRTGEQWLAENKKKEGVITLERLVELLVTNPHTRFGLPLGEDFSVWKIDEEFTVNPADFASMGRATPFEGWRLYGVNYLTVKDGKILYQHTV